MTRRRKPRTLLQRDVPPTNIPGLWGPGQTHRDAPMTPRQLTIWHFILGTIIVGGFAFLILGGVLHWG